MGLAASQGRLLMLTARKDDIEAQLMTLSNQKMSLARQSAKISDKYSDALNKKSLIWTTDDNNTTNLSYDLLMRPNTANASGQYIITNATNDRVLLDNNYVSNLGLASSGNAGDLSKTISESDFLQKLIGCDANTAISYIDDKNGDINLYPFTTNYSDSNDFLMNDRNMLNIFSNNQVAIGAVNPTSNDDNPISNLGEYINQIASSVSNTIVAKITEQLGDSNYGIILQGALNYATAATQAKFVENAVDTDSTDGVTLSGNTVYGSANSNQIYKSGSYVYVNGQQLINTFLNFFDLYCAQNLGGTIGNGNTVGTNSTSRTGTGGTGTTTAIISDGNTPAVNPNADINNNNISDSYEGSFYLNLYNAINNYGWETMNFSGTSENLSNQVLNGNIQIRTYDSDVNWQVSSTNDYNSPLGTKSDTEAAAKAEAEYDAEKDKLTSKETTLDVQMDHLDTERSAIQNEIESVQNIIKKRIESSFKIFDA